jgi:AcrR family transcriptional regulator
MNAVAAPVDTKTRILDAAERIFSQDGFDAASLRTITAAAQVNLAAVNYHFQTKEALFTEVIERRVRPINQRRLEMLDGLGAKPSAERIIEAFIRPPLDVCSGQPAIFRPLMARLHGVPRELHTRIIEDVFSLVFRRFADALELALPGTPREEIQWRLFFIIGAMAQTMAWGQIISKFMNSRSSADDLEMLTARLVSFGAAGMKATTKRVKH